MKRRYWIVFAAFGFIVFFALVSHAAEWKLFATSEGASHYYDPQRIKHVSKDTMQVWKKMVFKEKSIQDVVKMLGPEFKELSYEIMLCEYNCDEKNHRILSSKFYNKKRSVIHTSPKGSFSPWGFIIPDSVDGTLFNIVCGSR
ncbi:MAG: hypothetical protein OS130_07165 [Thermodesulfobacteriota bacterium]|jgi:hypothetical protein|nr:MAG: hypothetical protein OS130_07165 [Thermodesulfobacteriota bacterium]